MKCLAVLAYAIALTCLPFASAYSKSPQEIFRINAPSIVIVEALDPSTELGMSGSGVVVARGEVVTNCHVIGQAPRLTVRQGKSTYPATLRYEDRIRDLCQLNAPGLSAPPVMIGSVGSLEIGARVIAIGSPMGLELSASEGIISSIRELSPGSQIIQTTAPISAGSSGGGLFDEDGVLVGVTTAYLEDSQNLNFALPADWIRQLSTRHARTGAVEHPSGGLLGEQEKALDEIRVLGESLRAIDPQFSAKMQYIGPIVNSIVDSGIPPSEWRDAIEKAYWAFSDSNLMFWIEKSLSLEESNDWEGLIVHARKWTAADPENASAWYILGQGHNGLGTKYNHAAQYHFRNALDSPALNVKTTFYNMGEAESAKEDVQNQSALQAYSRAVKLDPKFVEAWVNLGIIALKLDDRSTAIAAYKALQELDPARAELLLKGIGMK